MDFDYLQVVLSDFTLKQLFVIHWFDKNLDEGTQDRHSRILDLLREYCEEDFKDWKSIRISQALMAINELGFLGRNEEKNLDEKLRTYLRSEKCSSTVVGPYIETCCDSRLKMSTGRKLTIFGMNHTYTGTAMIGDCGACKRKYFHNYYIVNKEKFVTRKSIFGSRLVHLGRDYVYDKTLITWLTNSILYLHAGFENFSKCYSQTKKLVFDRVDYDEGDMSPTRIQDFWFLYNFIVFSFFYADINVLKIPVNW